MNTNPAHHTAQLPIYFDASLEEKDRSLEALKQLCQQETHLSDYPLAAGVEKNILLFDGAELAAVIEDPTQQAAIKTDMTRCLRDGPGVFVIKSAYTDTSVIDASTELFKQIVADEKAAGQGKGDHFGSNERIWNSLQKVCLRSPADFIDYYSNPFLALACEAWLGPYYQITAQMNNVKPQGAAQSAHRDYHLGFQSRATIAQFPAHSQVMSQFLTLQGAIAHADTPLLSGPTLFLPFSQQLAAGYLFFREDAYNHYFKENYVQLPLNKGDMVFFSPALFHGAGTNQSTDDRIANLVQISSAFGRPMESIDRYAMIEAVYPELQARLAANTLSATQLRHAIAAVADGYSFPTNLDSDPPVGGNAPETAQQMMHRALRQGASLQELQTELAAYAERRLAYR